MGPCIAFMSWKDIYNTLVIPPAQGEVPKDLGEVLRIWAGNIQSNRKFLPPFFSHAWVSCLLSLSDLLVLFPDTCSTQPTSVTDIGAAIAHPSRESPWELSPSDHCFVLGWAAALGSMTHSDMPQVQREQHTSISDGEAPFLHKEDMVFPVGE